MANVIIKGATCDQYVNNLLEEDNFKNKNFIVTDTALCDDGLLMFDNSKEDVVICNVVSIDIIEELFRKIIHKIILSRDEEDKS